MTHPVIENFRRQFEYRASKRPETQEKPRQTGISGFLERINQYLIDNFGDELFPDGQTLTSTTETASGTKVICTRPLKANWRFNMPEPSQTNLIENVHDQIVSIIADEVMAEIRHIKSQYSTNVIPYILVDSLGVKVDPSTFEPVVSFCTVFGVEPDKDNIFVNNSQRAYQGTNTNYSIIGEIAERLIARHGAEIFPSGLYMEGPVTAVGDYVLQAKSRALATSIRLPPLLGTDHTAEILASIQNIMIDAAVDGIYNEIKTELAGQPGKLMIPYMIFGSEFDMVIHLKIRYDVEDQHQLLKSAYEHAINTSV